MIEFFFAFNEMRHRCWLILLFSIISHVVYANDICVITETDTTHHADFPAALTYANTSKKAHIRLDSNVSFENSMPSLQVKTNLSIDLNGFILGDTMSAISFLQLNNDTLTLSIYSSRLGGKIRAIANRNARQVALNISRGNLLLHDMALEFSNLCPYNETNKSVSAVAIYIGANSSMQMYNCDILCVADKAVYAVSGAGNDNSAADVRIKNCRISAQGTEAVYAVKAYTQLSLDSCLIDVAAQGQSAYGINLNNFYDSTQLTYTVADIRNLKLSVSAAQNAYGISSRGNLLLANDTIHADCISEKACAVYCDNTVNATFCKLTAESQIKSASALYIVNDTAHSAVSNSLLKALAGYTTAYALYMLRGNVMVEESILDAQARQDTATSFVDASVHALYANNSSSIEARNCQFSARATNTQFSRLAQCVKCSAGKLLLNNCSIDSYSAIENSTAIYLGNEVDFEGKDVVINCYALSNANAIYVLGDNTTCGKVNITNFDIKVEGNTNINGIRAYAYLTIRNSRVNVEAAIDKIYGIRVFNFTDPVSGISPIAIVDKVNVSVKTKALAYGVFSHAKINLTSDTITTQADSASSYTVYLHNNTKIHDCEVSSFAGRKAATAFYLSVDTINVELKNTNIKAQSNGDSAVGIHVNKGHLYASDCRVVVIVNQLGDTIFTDTFSRGIAVANAQTAQVNNTNFFVQATNSQAAKYIYGAYVSGEAVFDTCTITVLSKGQEAYSLYAYNTSSKCELNDCRLKTLADTLYACVRRNDAVIGKLILNAGYYSSADNLRRYIPTDSCGVYILVLGADYDEGYRYVIRPLDNPEAVITCVYSEEGEKSGYFYSLEAAASFAEKNPNKHFAIVMMSDYKLRDKELTIPNNASLVVPYYSDQTAPIGEVAMRTSEYKHREEYVRLILDSATLHIKGMLEVSARQYIGSGVIGSYGVMQLLKGSQVVLHDGASMHAWGCVIGEGEVHALAGSKVYEDMIIGDWKGGRMLYEVVDNPQRVFPITHYFYQNIEAPITYYSGAQAFASCSETAGSLTIVSDTTLFIGGKDALFVLDGGLTNSSSWIRKQYDASTDRLIFTTHGDVALDELNIALSSSEDKNFSYQLRSSHYIMPLTTNLTINCEQGVFTINRDVVMLPGAEISISSGASFVVPENIGLYLYDKEQWGLFLGTQYFTISWSPSWSVCPRSTELNSARLTVDGELLINGAVLATQGGAQVIGSANSKGVVKLTNGAPTTIVIFQLTGNTESYKYSRSIAASAPLRNQDGSLTATLSAMRGDIYNYTDGMWQSRVDDGCVLRITDNTGAHSYESANTQNELIEMPDHAFITETDGHVQWLVNDSLCNFIEVEKSGKNYYVYISDSLFEYYFYNDTLRYWQSQKRTSTYLISFFNYDDMLLYEVILPYGAVPVYVGETPRREADTEYTYTFAGWEPEPVPVTGNADYIAKYVAVSRTDDLDTKTLPALSPRLCLENSTIFIGVSVILQAEIWSQIR